LNHLFKIVCKPFFIIRQRIEPLYRLLKFADFAGNGRLLSDLTDSAAFARYCFAMNMDCFLPGTRRADFRSTVLLFLFVGY
jgi:hypothetical protein